MKRVILLALAVAGITAPAASADQSVGRINPSTFSGTRSAMAPSIVEQARVDRESVSSISSELTGTVSATATTAPYCKTTTNRGYETFLGATAFYFQLSVYWCHGTWYIGGTPSPSWAADSAGWLAGVFIKFDRYEDPQTYFYDYDGHGSRSGYAIKRRAYFAGCVDPIHAVCPNHWWIELHTYLHGDGTVYTNQIYG